MHWYIIKYCRIFSKFDIGRFPQRWEIGSTKLPSTKTCSIGLAKVVWKANNILMCKFRYHRWIRSSNSQGQRCSAAKWNINILSTDKKTLSTLHEVQHCVTTNKYTYGRTSKTDEQQISEWSKQKELTAFATHRRNTNRRAITCQIEWCFFA